MEDKELEECIVVSITGLKGNSSEDAIFNIVSMAYGHGYQIILLDDIDGEYKEVVAVWLEESNISYDQLLSRPEGNVESEEDVKRLLYDTHIKDKYKVKYVIDDHDESLGMWQAAGLVTLVW